MHVFRHFIPAESGGMRRRYGHAAKRKGFESMNWGSLVEQAVAIGLTQLVVVVFVVGVVVGIALVMARRR
jgi:hypothetical protein